MVERRVLGSRRDHCRALGRHDLARGSRFLGHVRGNCAGQLAYEARAALMALGLCSQGAHTARASPRPFGLS
eukprot:2755142-Heterocapsa_arctica.AAC.1